jgi:hypothetical protein
MNHNNNDILVGGENNDDQILQQHDFFDTEHQQIVENETINPQEQKVEDDLAIKEWIDMNGFGVCWELMSFFLAMLFHGNELNHDIQRLYNEPILAQALYCVKTTLVSLFLVRVGYPGILMNRYLRLQSFTGMLLYLLIYLIHIVFIMDYITFLDTNCIPNSWLCTFLGSTHAYIFSLCIFFHGPTSLILFPLRLIINRQKEPTQNVYFIKFCLLVTVNVWIYIFATHQDQKYNHTSKVLLGESQGNQLAKETLDIIQWIIIPFAKLCITFFIIAICKFIIDCIVRPAIPRALQLIRQRRNILLPQHVVHLE